jgi:RND family efflux transporter MFP subunit
MFFTPVIRRILGAVLLLLFLLSTACQNGAAPGTGTKDARPIPVEVDLIRQQNIELRRTFSGTLESQSRFVVSPKVGGRIQRLAVDLADSVEQGQVVAQLDDEEFQQELRQAKAELEVARANGVEAASNLEIAKREMERVRNLRTRGVATEAQVDAAQAQLLTREAAVEVARARVTRAEAALAGARIRLGYTAVTADWRGQGRRFVAQRHVNEGTTISANTPLFTIVELDPIMAVVNVTEKDYGLLRPGQAATVTTDAFTGTKFAARVARVAPVFNQASRQARVELELANPNQKLKPGMFIQAEILLDQATDAFTVPLSALVSRGSDEGVFLVAESGDRAQWHPVRTGIRQRDRVQVEGVSSGRVITMGQQLLQDGSLIVIPQQEPEAERTTE